MKQEKIEIKGEDGAIQIGEEWGLPNNMVGNYFYYKNEDIVFVYRETLDDTPWAFSYFKNSLKKLLSSKVDTQVDQILTQKPDSWLKKQLKSKFPSWFIDSSEDRMDDCKFFFQNPNGLIEIKKHMDSSDYIIEFEMPDPYPFDTSDDDEILFKGSLLVSERALTIFFRELKYNDWVINKQYQKLVNK